jgi:hypothetical protein
VANPVELIPLLIVALVLLSASGADVSEIEIAVEGDRTVTEISDVLIVGGGTATVPAGERVRGSVYVIGGSVSVAGEVEGDVVQLAGNLSVARGAVIAGRLQLFGGNDEIAEGAEITRRTSAPEALTPERSVTGRLTTLALQALVLAFAGGLLARRKPSLLRNVGDSITEHTLVSGTVGLLASATGVALVVFMAITVLLLPVSLLGIAVGVVVVAYAQVVYGHLLGTWLLLGRESVVGKRDLLRGIAVDSESWATGLGVVVFVVFVEVLGWLPVVGAVAQLALVLSGAGAVVITYFGVREFEPVAFPESGS